MANKTGPKVKVLKDGPYVVSGGPPLEKEIMVMDSEGNPEKWKKTGSYPAKETYNLCRCGNSSNKPFCDATHADKGFCGDETAKRKSYMELAEKNPGPGLDLYDAECYCSIAMFCHKGGDTWTLTEKSDNPANKKLAIQEACNCPSGRLVAWDKELNKSIEPDFKKSISLIEDTKHNVSGPIWLKGGIPIESSDGYVYEVRNRMNLCRCGRSKYKPFCDGSHIKAKFNDGDESVNKRKK
jgi:CDGSH-type Zn-finger protein